MTLDCIIGMRQAAQSDHRLSRVIPRQPEGEKLIAKDLGIEKLDLVPWDASRIKYISLDFNNIERLGGLGQFKNLVGVDLSNNNVGYLSLDLRVERFEALVSPFSPGIRRSD